MMNTSQKMNSVSGKAALIKLYFFVLSYALTNRFGDTNFLIMIPIPRAEEAEGAEAEPTKRRRRTTSSPTETLC